MEEVGDCEQKPEGLGRPTRSWIQLLETWLTLGYLFSSSGYVLCALRVTS